MTSSLQRLKLSVYHAFDTNGRPAYQLNTLDIFDSSNTISAIRDRVGKYLNIPEHLMLLFDTNNKATPLHNDTLISTVVASYSFDDDLISEPNKLDLYFGLRRCQLSRYNIQR